MCFGGSTPHDNSADIAAQQQAKNEANIMAGTSAVNDAFSKEFTPDYYSGITNAYESYYNPQLDQQYQNAVNALTDQLGQQGILQSTEGNRQLSLLKQTYDTNKQTVANNGLNAANTTKQNIMGQQNQLLAQAQQAGDPSAIASQAAQTVASNSQPSINYSPLGSVFAGVLGQGTNALSIQQGGVPVSTGNGTGGNTYSSFVYPGAGGGGSSSGGVVK